MNVLENIDWTSAIESKIDRSAWVKWKFSDLVDNIVEKIVPKESGLEHYIGLEHLDSGSLKIRRFGETAALKGDKLKIYSGDLIFAKRNAYLKRVAIADFDAVASAHSLVLRAKAETVLPEFLPFFLLSEKFWQRAIEISVGSLSPTINWKVLAKQEFLLPPKDQQAQLAELLWAMDEVIERDKAVLKQLENTYTALVDSLFTKKRDGWNYLQLKELGFINQDSLNSKTDEAYTFQYLDLASIEGPRKLGPLKSMMFKDAPSRARRKVSDESIVLALVRPYQKAFVYIEKSQNIIASTGTAVVRVHDDEKSKFIFHQFFSRRFNQFCEDRMTGTNYPAITPNDVKEFKVAIPNSSSIIVDETQKLEKITESTQVLEAKIKASKAFQKSLINQIF